MQCNKYYFKIFWPQEAGAFGNNIEKKPQKPHPKLKKICILYIYREHLLCLQFSASGSFLQKCIKFADQRLKFSHFEGGIILQRTMMKNLLCILRVIAVRSWLVMIYVMRWAIWYHLYNLKNVKNTHGGVFGKPKIGINNSLVNIMGT